MHLDCSKLRGSSIKKILRRLAPHWFQHPVHPTGPGPQSLAAEIQSTDVCTWLQERCQPQWARVMLPQQFLSCHCRAVPLLPCCRGSTCMENPPLLSDSVLVILFFTNRRWLSLQFAQQLIVPLWVVWVDSDRTGYQTPPGPNIHLRAYRV